MFKDVRFPTGIRYGAVGGPMFAVDVIEFDSGHEQRALRWSEGRCQFEVERAVTTDQKRKDLIAFFRIVRGKTYSFRVKDFSDFEVEAGEGVIGTLGNSQFQLYKRYTYDVAATGSPNNPLTYDRIITLPLSVQLYQNATLLTLGIHYSLNVYTGIVTMLGSPTITPTAWLGQFDVRCRFDVDRLSLVAQDIDVFMTQSITMTECRYEDNA